MKIGTAMAAALCAALFAVILRLSAGNLADAAAVSDFVNAPGACNMDQPAIFRFHNMVEACVGASATEDAISWEPPMSWEYNRCGCFAENCNHSIGTTASSLKIDQHCCPHGFHGGIDPSAYILPCSLFPDYPLRRREVGAGEFAVRHDTRKSDPSNSSIPLSTDMSTWDVGVTSCHAERASGYSSFHFHSQAD
jgi:hypothetical protein